MTYAVGWRKSAENDLAQIWSDAPDRGRITASADRIEDMIAHDPLSFGESRGDHTRIGFVAPLAVLFDVDTVNRRVTVWDIWRWRESA
jgi:hypothetical protein